jgi:hypothetical protein
MLFAWVIWFSLLLTAARDLFRQQGIEFEQIKALA